jgi:glycolate oxidase iron-sulfur subunit
LCLPHCPTFRVSGEEGLSPRGRIAAMRAVHHEGAPVDETFVRFVETCVQCRGCEPACPSGVPFGRLMEGTRQTLADTGAITPWWLRRTLGALRHPRLVRAGSTALAVLQRVRLAPGRASLPPLPLRRGAAVTSTGNDVWLFTGCVMDAWQRETHRSTARVLNALGLTYRVPNPGAGCCAGLHDDAVAMARSVIAAMPGDAPIVVNSAGCGAALKEYGRLLGTPAAERFAARVFDIHEFVAPRLDDLELQPLDQTVILQDPCHLRHVQRAHQAVRTVLAHAVRVVELDDDGLCCGAGGSYSSLQPELAAAIRNRKLAAITRAGGGTVASANPGCSAHLSAAGITVRHPIDLLAEALR